MPGWYDDGTRPTVPADPPDHVERPEPYTADEWAETEGSKENALHADGTAAARFADTAGDGPSDYRERALDAGYDPSDPKAISLEMDGLL